MTTLIFILCRLEYGIADLSSQDIAGSTTNASLKRGRRFARHWAQMYARSNVCFVSLYAHTRRVKSPITSLLRPSRHHSCIILMTHRKRFLRICGELFRRHSSMIKHSKADTRFVRADVVWIHTGSMNVFISDAFRLSSGRIPCLTGSMRRFHAWSSRDGPTLQRNSSISPTRIVSPRCANFTRNTHAF